MSVLEVRGADRLEATMIAAGRELGDLSAVNRRVADLVLSRARPRTPVRTGRLVGSLRGDGNSDAAEMGSSLVYAGPIHNGWPAHHITANPFISDAVRGNVDAIVGLYLDEIDSVLEGVQGA